MIALLIGLRRCCCSSNLNLKGPLIRWLTLDAIYDGPAASLESIERFMGA